MMKKILVPVMAVAAISVAVPAAAQHYGPPRGGPAYGQHHAGPPMAVRVRHLERNLAFAHRARVMSTSKARDFQRGIDRLVHLERQYGPRMTLRERHDLERRYQDLDRSIDRYVQRARYRR